jgi:hypothetical protein
MMNSNYLQQNNSLIAIAGPMLINRLLWPGIGLVILLITYLRFNFETFFAGRRDKAAADEVSARSNVVLKTPVLNFTGRYNRRTLAGLIRLELLNIIRDNYFWLIIGIGSVFLGFGFWMRSGPYGVPEWPRTVLLLSIFADAFPFFIFFIILFYTGETLGRDKLTRYAFINDSLPPPNWVLNGSKLISLLVISAGLTSVPMVVGIAVQLAKGYTHLNWSMWLSYLFVIMLPKFLTGAVLCYMILVVINNKFVGYAVVATLWIGMFLLDSSGTFNYHLLLYSFTPDTGISDMDGMGHMVGPISLFDLYWMLGAGLLIVVAALWYHRGVSTSLKERWQLVPERFDRKTKWFTAVLGVLFLAVGGYVYYNVSYLNEWLTKGEGQERAITYEKALKKYQALPLPRMTGIAGSIDLYPEEKKELFKASITIVNPTSQPVSEMLLDGDNLTGYTINENGRPLSYTSPLLYPRGKFSWFRPKQDTAPFRLYRLLKPLAPGDSVVLALSSTHIYAGFPNGLFATNLLDNGTIFAGGLPGLGYDDDDEVRDTYIRKKAGLPPKADENLAQNDPVGRNALRSGDGIFRTDITVSVPEDETAVCPGDLVAEWTGADGRKYFHYRSDRPGMYPPFAVMAARYADRRDSVMIDHPVAIDIYYHPGHDGNLDRYLSAYKDGLRYFSQAYGSYPFHSIRQVELSNYGPWEMALSMVTISNERNGWNLHFTRADQFDFLYKSTTLHLSQQWWQYQVAPNNTVGSQVISEGLPGYESLVMLEKKYGKANMLAMLQDHIFFYDIITRRLTEPEHPVLTANQFFEWANKAGVVLYGLRDLIGEENMNAALREFRDSFSFRAHGPYAGANDLYAALKKRVPDSLQYYLTDTWEKVTLYDNKVISVSAVTTGRPNEYKVTMQVEVAKNYKDDRRNDIPAVGMNDYIDIGVLGADTVGAGGLTEKRFLYLHKYKLTQGRHEISVVVEGEPKEVGIDPLGLLIDRNRNDNSKKIE